VTTSALTPAGSTRRWRRIRAYVLDRDGHRCQVPLLDRPGLCLALAEHVDHIEERCNGGTDDPANLRAACSHHNLARPARPRSTISSPARRERRWSW